VRYIKGFTLDMIASVFYWLHDRKPNGKRAEKWYGIADKFGLMASRYDPVSD
jgi:hypothetical protein